MLPLYEGNNNNNNTSIEWAVQLHHRKNLKLYQIKQIHFIFVCENFKVVLAAALFLPIDQTFMHMAQLCVCVCRPVRIVNFIWTTVDQWKWDHQLTCLALCIASTAVCLMFYDLLALTELHWSIELQMQCYYINSVFLLKGNEIPNAILTHSLALSRQNNSTRSDIQYCHRHSHTHL